jgi:Zn-dependent protease with chaperone function
MEAGMMKRFPVAAGTLLAGAIALGPLSDSCAAQATVKRSPSGFNLFSVQQDVELGQQSAAEAERQLPLLNDRTTNRYLNQIIQRLAAVAPGAKYPYQIKAVNATEINAFSLPGGPMYVNRGLITSARSEAELAGVLSHEMAHVALRHGTNQASKAYLGQAGLGILGGLLGKKNTTSQIVNSIGGVGLNAVFLKFSRDDEHEADALGADMMARAGYDPIAMATFFELLRTEQNHDPSKLERFFASHPPAGDREARIRQLASGLGTARTQPVGNFDRIRRALGSSSIASSQTQWPDTPAATPLPPTAPVEVVVAPPSSRFVRFEAPNGFFSILHPDNWRRYAATPGLAVSFAPDGGVVTLPNGQPAMVHGVIINHYAPFEGASDRLSNSLQRHYAPFEDRNNPRGSLEDATDDLVRQILRSNPYLRAEEGSAKPELIDGQSGYSVLMTGISPVTGEEERVTAFTRELADGHVVYALCIAPGRDYSALNFTFTTMVRSLRVNDAVAHRATRTRPGNNLRRPD